MPNSPVPAVFRRTITPEGQNTFKQPGKHCRTQRITIKVTNFTEFQNWSLPVVVPGFCLASCCVAPKGCFAVAPLLKKAKYILLWWLQGQKGSPDFSAVILTLAISHCTDYSQQKQTNEKKFKKLTFYRHSPRSYWLWCRDKYLVLPLPNGLLDLDRMLSQSFLFAILLQRLDIFQKRELKRRLKEDQWLSGKIIISSSRYHTAYWKAFSEVPSMGSALPLSSPPIPFQLVFNPPKPHVCTDS